MQGGQAPLQASPKRILEQLRLVAEGVVDLGGLGIRRLGGGSPGGREVARTAFDLRAEKGNRLAGGAHLFALVLPQGFAPASDFLELASIHGRIISRA